MKHVTKIISSTAALSVLSIALGQEIQNSTVEAASFSSGDKVVVTASKLNVRSIPSTKGSLLGTLRAGESIQVVSDTGTWAQIQFKGKPAYVSKAYLKKQTEPAASIKSKTGTTTANLNIRQSPSTSGKPLVTLKRGTVLQILQEKNGWFQVQSGSYRGWVHSGYVSVSSAVQPAVSAPQQPVPQQPTVQHDQDAVYKVTATTLRVRSNPNAKASIIGYVQKNDSLQVIRQEQNGWYQIQLHGKTGFVSGDYVVKTSNPVSKPEQTVSPAPQPTAPSAVLPAATASSYKELDLRKPANVTAQVINAYIADYEKKTGKTSILAGKGQLFIDAGRQYGVNELFLAALALHESAFGTSYIAKGKNNLFGLKAYNAAPYDCAYYFHSLEENITYQAAYLRKYYLEPTDYRFNGPFLGDKTKGINKVYSSDPSWAQKIADHMQKMKAYNAADYETVSPSNVKIQELPVPGFSVLYPQGITGTANQDLRLYNSPKGAALSQKLAKGTEFSVLEKTNDFWLKIKVNNSVYWTTFNFSQYKSYMSIYNLLRVESSTGAVVREQPNDSSRALITIPNYTYVQGVITAAKTIELDSSGTWYKVKLPNTNQEGWIYKSHVKTVFQ